MAVGGVKPILIAHISTPKTLLCSSNPCPSFHNSLQPIMESLGAASMMESNFFNATEGYEVMEQLLSHYSSIEGQESDPALGSIQTMFACDSYYWSQPSGVGTLSTMNFVSSSESEMYYDGDSTTTAMDHCINVPSPVKAVPNPQLEDSIYQNGEMNGGHVDGYSNVRICNMDQISLSKRKLHTSYHDQPIATESRKNKPRFSVKAHNNKKNQRPEKAWRITELVGEEEVSASPSGRSSSSCSSVNDLNASEELNGGGGASSSSKVATQSVNRKTRASGVLTVNPQSLYARNRREKINERLRILQNLVPNGTKVDISTMLEEAVDYVKFLQLQIKLLSSNDLWMYSPIAYNGMDIGIGARYLCQSTES